MVRTIATKGEGMNELIEAIYRHYEYLKNRGILQAKRKDRVRREITETIKERLWRKYFLSSKWKDSIDRCVEKVVSGEETPYSMVEKIIKEI